MVYAVSATLMALAVLPLMVGAFTNHPLAFVITAIMMGSALLLYVGFHIFRLVRRAR